MLFDSLYKFKNKFSIFNELNIEIKYSDLIKYSDNLSKNFSKRSLVFLITNNCIESLVAYIALIRSNCAVLIIDNNIKLLNFIELFNNYFPDYIITPKKYISRKTGLNLSLIDQFQKYDLLENNNKVKYPLNENLMLLLPTSGSLGSPKYVKLSYSNIYENIISISKYLDFDESHRAITTMPMSYSYGLSIINSHLFNGASIVLNNRSFFDKKFWTNYVNFKVNNFGGVPYHYEILNKLKFSNIINDNLKYITQAGGTLNNSLTEELVNLCIDKNIDFFTMYGQAEASPRISYMKVNDHLNKIGSIGKAIPGGRLWIEEKGKMINTPNTVGNLYYEGKNVFMGYSENYKELFSSNEINNILNTGDIAKYDSDNFFYIVGREQRIFKQYGERISLDFIENKLSENGYECACIGINQKIFIFTTNDLRKDFISNLINILPSRYELRLIDEIPRSVNGKILYNEINI